MVSCGKNKQTNNATYLQLYSHKITVPSLSSSDISLHCLCFITTTFFNKQKGEGFEHFFSSSLSFFGSAWISMILEGSPLISNTIKYETGENFPASYLPHHGRVHTNSIITTTVIRGERIDSDFSVTQQNIKSCSHSEPLSHTWWLSHTLTTCFTVKASVLHLNMTLRMLNRRVLSLKRTEPSANM